MRRVEEEQSEITNTLNDMVNVQSEWSLLTEKLSTYRFASPMGESWTLDITDIPSRILSGMPSSVLHNAESAYTAYLVLENAQLHKEIDNIKDMLNIIMERLPEEKVVVLRELTREEAKKEIESLFSSGNTYYYSDIARELSLELQLVVDICNELQKEGSIDRDDSTH